jgi:hypothetical protein
MVQIAHGPSDWEGLVYPQRPTNGFVQAAWFVHDVGMMGPLHAARRPAPADLALAACRPPPMPLCCSKAWRCSNSAALLLMLWCCLPSAGSATNSAARWDAGQSTDDAHFQGHSLRLSRRWRGRRQNNCGGTSPGVPAGVPAAASPTPSEADCSFCPEGQYVAAACSYYQSRVCRDCSVCSTPLVEYAPCTSVSVCASVRCWAMASHFPTAQPNLLRRMAAPRRLRGCCCEQWLSAASLKLWSSPNRTQGAN